MLSQLENTHFRKGLNLPSTWSNLDFAQTLEQRRITRVYVSTITGKLFVWKVIYRPFFKGIQNSGIYTHN